MGYLVEIRERGKSSRRLVVDDRVEVGRTAADVCVEDALVSRRHLLLTVQPTGLAVLDLGSSNGTTVNGGSVAGETTARPGDVIGLGQSEIEVIGAAGGPVLETAVLETVGRPEPTPQQRLAVAQPAPAESAEAAAVMRPGPAALAGAASAIRHRPLSEGFQKREPEAATAPPPTQPTGPGSSSAAAGTKGKRQGSFFICYRRDDAAGHAGRLYDELKAAFGADRVFMDVARIAPGADFDTSINEVLERCDTMLVVIGSRWQGVGRGGQRRLDDPSDYVRIEVASALRRRIRLIPVLVNGAAMPEETELPAELKPLMRRQAFDLANHRWERDVTELVARLRPQRRLSPAVWVGLAAVLLLAGAISTGLALLSGDNHRPKTGPQVLLSDSLHPVNLWPQDDDQGCKHQFTAAGYRLTNTGNLACSAPAPIAGDVLNVSMAAVATFPVPSQGSSGSANLVCRRSDNQHFYRAGVDPDGFIYIDKGSGRVTTLKSSIVPIDRQAAQHLRFDCLNQPDGTALLTFSLADRPVLTARDSAPLPAGQVRIEATSYTDRGVITAQFSDFVASDLSDSARLGSASSTNPDTVAGAS